MIDSAFLKMFPVALKLLIAFGHSIFAQVRDQKQKYHQH